MDRQLDFPLALQRSIEIPNFLPGKLRTDDFIYFNWPSTINPNDYEVAVSVIDTSGISPSNPHSKYRIISDLRTNVFLPWVHLGAHSEVVVISKKPNKPKFISRLNRGSTYVIPSITNPGLYQMQRHGVLTSSVENW